jgi:hypothetical protein
MCLLCLVRPVDGVRLFLIICTGGAHVPQSGHKTAEDREATHKPLDILDVPDLTYFHNG